MYVCVYVCVFMCACACVYVCVCVRMSACCCCFHYKVSEPAYIASCCDEPILLNEVRDGRSVPGLLELILSANICVRVWVCVLYLCVCVYISNTH